MRPEPRYYEDEPDNGYGAGYSVPGYATSIPSGPPETHVYRDLPAHTRADGYGPSR